MKFLSEIEPFMSKAESGDYAEIQRLIYETVQELHGTWPLEGYQPLTSLERIRKLNEPSSIDIGHWFLILLSKHLYEPPTINVWSALKKALQLLGLSKQDCEMLNYGLPIHLLLKPNEPKEVPWPLPDLYWYWLTPNWESRAGWLPNSEVTELYDKISFIGESGISSLDICQVLGLSQCTDAFRKEHDRFLIEAYENAKAVLTEAIKRQLSLFLVYPRYVEK
jgi:hypothetical protein